MKRQVHSWVSSPFGRNSLLTLFKNEERDKVDKYRGIREALSDKKNFKTCNKVFYSNPSNVKDKLHPEADLEQVDFQNIDGTLKTITTWLNKHTTFDDLSVFSAHETILMANISTIELLELPMSDNDFKLVILVPNEADVLNSLFNKLTNEGFTAATGCITPLFTSVSQLNAPSIEFKSSKIEEYVHKHAKFTATEYGNVKVNEQGISIKVLTCYASNIKGETSTSVKVDKVCNPFFFAVIFKDMPIFSGYYESINK